MRNRKFKRKARDLPQSKDALPVRYFRGKRERNTVLKTTITTIGATSRENLSLVFPTRSDTKRSVQP